jgi:uncharacterized protein YbcI
MLLIQFLFHVNIIEMENRLSQVEDKIKVMKDEAVSTKDERKEKEEATKKEEEAKRLMEITTGMVCRWWKYGGQGCSKDPSLKM